MDAADSVGSVTKEWNAQTKANASRHNALANVTRRTVETMDAAGSAENALKMKPATRSKSVFLYALLNAAKKNAEAMDAGDCADNVQTHSPVLPRAYAFQIV